MSAQSVAASPTLEVRARTGWLDRGAAALAIAAMLCTAHVWISEPAASDGNAAERVRRAPAQAVARILRGRTDTPDIQGAVYGGYSSAQDSNIDLQQPGGTDMRIHNVRWGSEPDKMPPYHGFRASWWLPFGQSLGGMTDLVYVKAVADRDREVRQSGIRGGRPVPETEPLSATFQRLEFTDGLNLLTANIVYRLPFFGRVRPYLGAGLGASIPHAEVQRANSSQRTFSFQLAGYVVQAFAGVEFQVASRGSVFAEYRSSYAVNTVQLIDGGTLRTDLWIHHFSTGGSGHLRRSAAPNGH